MTQQYKALMQEILDKGTEKTDRTGVGTISLFSPNNLEFDLREGFPLLTTKQVAFRVVKEELLWFLSGSDSLKPLLDKDVHIWDGNGLDYWLTRMSKIIDEQFDRGRVKTREEVRQVTYDVYGLAFDPREFIGSINNRLESKDYAQAYDAVKQLYFKQVQEGKDKDASTLGHIYGVAWRNYGFKGIDQIKNVIKSLKEDPDGRRHIINAWHPEYVQNKGLALPPCHVMVQFYVEDNKYLHCKMFQRSCDGFLGIPVNIASYALLTHLIARETGYEVGRLIITMGDAHIYMNHMEVVKEQLTRESLPLPQLEIQSDKDIFHLTAEDIKVVGYQHQGKLVAPMAI